METNKKIAAIQSLRALAFIGIVCQHGSFVRLGTWGVSVFFVLSGFILTVTSLSSDKSYPVSVKGGIYFSFSKIHKLYFTHIATMLTMLLLICYQMHLDGILNFSTVRQQFCYVVLNSFLIQDWFWVESVRCSLNGVAWYLSAMTFLYFMFPLLLAVIRKYKTIRSAVLALGIGYAVQSVITILTWNFARGYFIYVTYFFPPYRCFDFFAGCNIGYLYDRFYGKSKAFAADKHRGNHKKCDTLYELLAMIFAAAAIFADWNASDLRGFNNSLLYLPSSCVMVYVFAHSRGIITKWLGNKVFVHIGNISGHAFLISQVVLYYS